MGNIKFTKKAKGKCTLTPTKQTPLKKPTPKKPTPKKPTPKKPISKKPTSKKPTVASPTISKVGGEEEIHMVNVGGNVEEEVMYMGNEGDCSVEEEIHMENEVHDKVVEEEEIHMENEVHDKVVEEEEMLTENAGGVEARELEHEMHTTPEPTKKRESDKVRGRSVMKGLGLMSKKPKKVRFNKNDQPIGKNSVRLSSFLGVLVRRNLSLNYNDWRKVKKEVKDNLWAAVTQRFAIDDYYKDYYVGKMGCLLKDARSRAASLVLGAFLLEEEERNQKLDAAKPDNMTTHEWETFIHHVRSPTFKAKRILMQEVREHNNTPHTISRKGYARLEEDLKKEREVPVEDQIDAVDLWKVAHKQRKGKHNLAIELALEKLSKLQEESSGSSLKEDLLSKAVGEERPGRVRGMGFGVTRTKLNLQSKIQEQCNKSVKELKDYVQVLSNRIVLLEEKNSTGENGSPATRIVSPNSGNASNNLLGPIRGSLSGGSSSGGSSSGGSPMLVPNIVQVPKKGQPCKIMSWYNEGELVADGKVHEVDSRKELHGMPIGIGAYSVWVEYPHVPDALLYKPTSEFRRVKDAVGTIVAWNKDFISFAA